MAISSHGTTFSFSGFSANVTSISIEEAQSEVVDMTAIADPVGYRRLVATGAILTAPKVSIEFIRTATTPAPLFMQGATGTLSISSPSINITKLAAVESLTHEMAVGDVIRGQASFLINLTD